MDLLDVVMMSSLGVSLYFAVSKASFEVVRATGHIPSGKGGFSFSLDGRQCCAF